MYSNSKVININSDNFSELVLESDELWFIQFYTEWCGLCRHLQENWIEAAYKMKGIVKFGVIDVDDDDNKEIAIRYNANKLPWVTTFG